MTTWTDTARQRLDRYFEDIRGKVTDSGADADEVCDDLRRHIDEEVSRRQLEVVTEEDVRQILAQMGAPEATAPAPEATTASPAPPAAAEVGSGQKKRPHWWWLIFSVLLPFATVGIELLTHMCAGVFFDPIPTVWHALMVAAVPAANLWVWQVVRQSRTHARPAADWANGFAVGIAAFYSLLYLPVFPFALVGVLYLGWGLLPLSPLFALIGALALGRHLRRMPAPAGRGRWRGTGAGFGLAALALAFTVLPITATRYWTGRAAAGSPAQRASAVGWLRLLGQERTLLGDCYGTTSWMRQSPIDLHLFGVPVSPKQAREVYFRVTGQPFNTLPPPQLNFTRGGWNLLDDLTWDREQGGKIVGSRIKGLSLAASRIDGLVEADAALGYVEWTLEFRNDSRRQREARAQIALPPGGVVSRLTLWVNGEEREAAFAGRAKVRQAYEKVAIRQRRDPVLVTSDGPDRVLMQCFPVPPEGGRMKVRLGITAPLVMESLDHGVLRWPIFLERNFSLADGFTHSLWVESSAGLTSNVPELKAELTPTKRHALRGHVANPVLEQPQSALHGQRAGNVEQVWTMETADKQASVIVQTFTEKPAMAPRRVVLVVDGSIAMKSQLPVLAKAMSRFPDGIEVSVVIAGDEVALFPPTPEPSSAEVRQELAARLRRVRAAGGQDNLPALLRGWELAAERTNAVVLWVHGPQPVRLTPVDELAQRFLWRGGQIRIYDFQTQVGPNRIIEELDGISAVQPVPRMGGVQTDLERLFTHWDGAKPVVKVERRKVAATAGAGEAKGPKVSKHLARLWAFEEVSRLLARRLREAAVRLAAEYQLVTPVSGAVVLETQKQFQQAGLEPVSAESVPSVPEPAGLWWVAGAAWACWAIWKRKRRWRRHRERMG